MTSFEMQLIPARLSLVDIVHGLSDELVSHNLPDSFVARGVSIDTRTISPDMLFVAICGDNFDGHSFVNDALLYGASCVIVENSSSSVKLLQEAGSPHVVVRNSIIAMQKMATYRRRVVLCNAKVVGITGSVGKTTITNWMVRCLSKFCDVFGPRKNFNNHIGLPLTILNTHATVNILVLEMGMGAPGDISILGKIAMPDIVIITNVGVGHIGSFGGDINEVVKAKGEIFLNINPGAVAILNESDAHFSTLLRMAQDVGIKNIVRVGVPDKSHVYVKDCKPAYLTSLQYVIGTKISSGTQDISCIIDCIGKHNAFNTLFIFAVAILFKIDVCAIADTLSTVSVLEGRGNVEYVFFNNKSITVINSTYNSNPSSLGAAIVSLGELKKLYDKNIRSVCVIGDMLSLGNNSSKYHTDLLDVINDNNVDGVIAVGQYMKELYNLLPETKKIGCFKHSTSLSKQIRSLLQNGDIVLFKASNGVKMDIALDKLYR